MKDKIKSICEAVASIEKLGTRVVSFDYNGTPRNVVVGAVLPNGAPRWAEKTISRSLYYYKGHTYLVPRVMNDNPQYKAFDLNKIENFSFKA